MTTPFPQCAAWLEEARACGQMSEPTAMSLATVSADGKPSVRIVLLKGYDERGFVFYTNLESRKSEELGENAHAALCFYWMPLARQLRIEGRAQRVSEEEADAYFATRPRESQIGAWASAQSRVLTHPDQLQHTIAQMDVRFAEKSVPRPAHWGGWRVVPEVIEFWQQGDFRLHERLRYTRTHAGWDAVRLYP